MSDLGSEIIMENAQGMNEEDVKAFLTQVKRHLLEEELRRRADETEQALDDIRKRLLQNVSV